MSKSDKMRTLAANMAGRKNRKPNPFIDIDNPKANRKKYGYEIDLRKGRRISVRGTGR